MSSKSRAINLVSLRFLLSSETGNKKRKKYLHVYTKALPSVISLFQECRFFSSGFKDRELLCCFSLYTSKFKIPKNVIDLKAVHKAKKN